MKVKDLISQLKECNQDADVLTSLFDNATSNLNLIIGVDDRINYIVLFQEIAYGSRNNTRDLSNNSIWNIFKNL